MAPEAIRALAGREARPLAVHVGGGIATRDAYHEQRAAHREALERGTAGAPERLALPVVTVPAASIVVAEGGPNYRPVVKSEGKQEKQARRRATATATAGGRRWSRRWRASRLPRVPHTQPITNTTRGAVDTQPRIITTPFVVPCRL